VSGDFLVNTQAVVVVLGMNSNHELDMFFRPCNLLILQKSVMSPKASTAGLWYKIGTKSFAPTSSDAQTSRSFGRAGAT
jgi:hypothetical protein